MQTKVINPYPALGNMHADSLDFIIANLPPNPTFEDLNTQLANSLFDPDPLHPDRDELIKEYMKTVLPNAYNGYVNSCRLSVAGCQSTANGEKGGYWRYNENQMGLINHMLNGINAIPPESIWEYLATIDEDIVAGKLSYEEQMPLLVATAIGKRDHEYWMEQIATPGTWAAYLNTNVAINYAHLAGIVSASLQGALLTYGLIKPPQIQLLDAFTSAISATGLAAGKVVFGWIPG